MNGQIDKITLGIKAKDFSEIMCELNYLRVTNETNCKTIKELREKIAELTTSKEKGEK